MRFKARVSRSFAVPFFCPYIPGHLPRQPRRHSSVGCDRFAQVDTDKTVITLKAAPGSFFFRVFFVMLCLRLFFFLLPSKDGGRIKNHYNCAGAWHLSPVNQPLPACSAKGANHCRCPPLVFFHRHTKHLPIPRPSLLICSNGNNHTL